jgi:hypothetical protein
MTAKDYRSAGTTEQIPLLLAFPSNKTAFIITKQMYEVESAGPIGIGGA